MKIVVLKQTDGETEWMGLSGELALVQREDLLKLLERSKKLITDMMPGVRHIALQNYAELNDVQVDLDRAVLQLGK